jgi:hypothetical protein
MGFLLSFGGGRKIFFIFPLFQQVPNVFPMGFLLSFGGEGGGGGRFFSFSLCSNRFPMCPPWVFPIAPCFKFCSKSSHSHIYWSTNYLVCTLEAPQIRSFYWKMECLPLG